MKFKDRLKDKYYLLMICSLVVTVLWTLGNLNRCTTEVDEMLLVIYAIGFMSIPYIAKRFHIFG